MRARAAGLCILLAAACGDDAERRVPSLDDYTMPAPRAIGDMAGVPLEAARFRVDAGDVRYVRDGLDARIGRVSTTLSAAGGSSVDLFDVAAERVGPNGDREWRIASDALRLRDLRVIGEARAVTLLPARLVVDAAGRPRMTGTLSARASTDASGQVRGSACRCSSI